MGEDEDEGCADDDAIVIIEQEQVVVVVVVRVDDEKAYGCIRKVVSSAQQNLMPNYRRVYVEWSHTKCF